MKRISTLAGAALSLALFFLLGATNASAGSIGSICDSPAWTANQTGPNYEYPPNINPGTGVVTNWDAGDPLSLGDVFQATSGTEVCALGIYAGNNATYVNSPETVGLYDSTGNLLTSTTVTDTDYLYDGYYWNATTPVTLTPGDVYTVVNFTNLNGWGYGSVINDEAAFIDDDFASSGSLVYPNTAGRSGPAYIGGNILFVPEGNALPLLGVSLLGLAFAALWMSKSSRPVLHS
jgi:hypothetical protein